MYRKCDRFGPFGMGGGVGGRCVCERGHRGSEFSRKTAEGKKLFLNQVVLVWRLLYRPPEGRRANSLCAGWQESEDGASRRCPQRQEVRPPVFTTLCIAFQSATEPFPYLEYSWLGCSRWYGGRRSPECLKSGGEPS